jgi:hypothetical protein
LKSQYDFHSTNRNHNFGIPRNRSNKNELRRNSRDNSNTHLNSQRSLKGTSIYNNQSLNRDRTIDSFDIVESNQNSFANLSQRPPKRTPRKFKPGILDQFNLLNS